MARIVAFTAISLTIAVVVSSELSFSRAQEEHEERCGTVHKLRLAPLTGPRFLQIADYDGRSFVDMQTCLVARLEVFSEPMTLADAMQRCATLGQGGPRGNMGWQLPTAAELTSLDGEEWNKLQGDLAFSGIPPLKRSETPFWTMTKWPGVPDSLAVVEFSALTTIVRPLAETMKAGVWCVRASPATDVR
jgi:hypothetical protein